MYGARPANEFAPVEYVRNGAMSLHCAAAKSELPTDAGWSLVCQVSHVNTASSQSQFTWQICVVHSSKSRIVQDMGCAVYLSRNIFKFEC